MTFSFPIALALTALALPIVALYVMKVRLRRVSVSTNMFWKQIYEEKPPRALWQHFRDLVSLVLQLLLLALLVLAIADPQFLWHQTAARRVVIVMDNSASMQATDLQPDRLEAARNSALTIIDGLRHGDQMAIVQSDRTPKVLVGMTDHAPTLRRAVSSIPRSAAATALTPAIELAHALIGPHPQGQIMVLTDGCVSNTDLNSSALLSTSIGGTEKKSDEPKPAQGSKDATPGTFPIPEQSLPSKQSNTTVDYLVFASEAANIGITQFQVRRSFNDPIAYEILASVKNASTSPVSCRLELSLNNIPVDVIPLKLAADEKWTRTIEKTSVEGGELKAVLTGIQSGSVTSDSTSPDLLLADNEAWAILPGRERQNVLLISQGNLFLSKVMEANPLAEITVQKEFPAQWPNEAIIVLHGKVPARLPDGNVFVIAPTNDCDHWALGENLEDPLITEQDSSSPLMAHVRLDNVVIPQARQLKFTSPPHSLAKSATGDVVYAEIKRPNGRCLVLNVDIDSSDLAFRTAFPILVTNAVNWFSGTSGELELAISPGEVARLSGDFSATNTYVLQSPTSQSRAVQTSDADANNGPVIGPLNEAGIWNVTAPSPSSASGAGRSLAKIAVSLANEQESDLRPQKVLQDAENKSSMKQSWFNRPLWTYLALAACLLMTLEWALYQRRFTS